MEKTKQEQTIEILRQIELNLKELYLNYDKEIMFKIQGIYNVDNGDLKLDLDKVYEIIISKFQ